MNEFDTQAPEQRETADSHVPGEGFAAVLHSHRMQARLTQEDLAHLAQVSPRSVRNIERGLVHKPRAETVRLLAQALRLEGADLEAFVASAREHYWRERTIQRKGALRRVPPDGRTTSSTSGTGSWARSTHPATASADAGDSHVECCCTERRWNRGTAAAVMLALGVALTPVVARRLFPTQRNRVATRTTS
ncbi:MAG: hypothetical protein QG608_2120 [Actinomycetota bacterium]|nr:hypothetical protein [Actinomycetota bacterium]